MNYFTAQDRQAAENVLAQAVILDMVRSGREVTTTSPVGIEKAYMADPQKAIDMEDEYVMECQGLIPMDEDELNELVRSRQPEIIINNRLGRRRHGDYTTPERQVGEFNVINPWETCDTLSQSWGWMPDRRIRPTAEIIHLLADVITGGGNLLLNLSPRGDGSIEPEHEARLLEVGEWLERYGEAVYGTRGGPVRNNVNYGGAVWKENKLWFHIKNPECVKFRVPVGNIAVNDVTALTGEPCEYSVSEGILTVTLPETDRDPIETLVRITLADNAGKIADFTDIDNFDAFSV